MTRLYSFFRKAKAWQLFLLMIVLPFFLQFGLMVTFAFITVKHIGDPKVTSFVPFYIIPIVLVLALGSVLMWMRSIVFGLEHRVPEEARVSLKGFNFFSLIPIFYFFLLGVFLFFLLQFIASVQHQPTQDFPSVGVPFIAMFVLIVPLHLLSIAGLFYSFYITAKTIRSVELGRKVVFSDYAGEFFLLWFHLIGIWIIQPRINEMFKEEKSL